MPCFTCITSRNKVIVYDHPDQLQGQYDPETRATSYIMPPKHLSHGRSPGCKQPSKFFDLPGEVRNQIYELVVEPENYEVAWLDKIGGSLTHWKHKTEKPNWLNEFEFRRQFKDKRVREAKWADQFTKPDLDPKYIERRRREMRQPRHHVKTPNSFFDAVKGPAAMLRVSKQIHDEFAQFFYSSVSVSFQNHKILTHWLGLLTPVARKNLTKLYLQHQGYGEPKMFKNVQWKEKHDKLWAKRLKTVVEEFPNLQELHLGLRILENPPGLNHDATWAQPLKVLKRLKHLTNFELNISWDQWNIYNNDKVTLASERVKQWIMGPRFNPEKLRYIQKRLSFPISKEGKRYNPKTGEISRT